MISRSTPAGKFSSRLSLRNQPCGLDYSFEERKRNEYIPLFDCVLRLYHFVAQVPRSGTGTTKWHRYHEVAQALSASLRTPLRDWDIQFVRYRVPGTYVLGFQPPCVPWQGRRPCLCGGTRKAVIFNNEIKHNFMRNEYLSLGEQCLCNQDGRLKQ